MKIMLPLFLVTVALLVGCTPRYTITLNNGTQITSRGKPKMVQGAFVFTDITGQRRAVSGGSVREVAPASHEEAPASPARIQRTK